MVSVGVRSSLPLESESNSPAKEQKDWRLQRCYQNMKLALAALSAFALVSGASALRLMTYRDYISQDPSLPHCNTDVYLGGYGYQGAKCGCLDHEKKTKGLLHYSRKIGGWVVPYYAAKCKGKQFDEEMDGDQNIGYGHNPWGPEGQYNGRGVNSHSFSNPQGGVHGNSFSQNFDTGRSLRGSRCPKKLKCKFTEKFCRKNFGNGYFPAKRSPEECCPSMCLQQRTVIRL